jgi:hypothetical protein
MAPSNSNPNGQWAPARAGLLAGEPHQPLRARPDGSLRGNLRAAGAAGRTSSTSIRTFFGPQLQLQLLRRLQQQPGCVTYSRLQAGRQPAPDGEVRGRARAAEQGQHLHLPVRLPPGEGGSEQRPAAADEIPLDFCRPCASAARAFNWIRDTRDAPLDAHRGTYTSFQEFISSSIFDSQANFNQVDVSNSSYYQFGHDRFVLARNTRYGQERAYGAAKDERFRSPSGSTPAAATRIAALASTPPARATRRPAFPSAARACLSIRPSCACLRRRCPTSAIQVSFVLFHDMGNVFTNASDIWPSCSASASRIAPAAATWPIQRRPTHRDR